MTQEQIVSLQTLKHVKIYKLHQLGLSNKVIAAILRTNTGHVYNALKDYSKKPDKAAKADVIV